MTKEHEAYVNAFIKEQRRLMKLGVDRYENETGIYDCNFCLKKCDTPRCNWRGQQDSGYSLSQRKGKKFEGCDKFIKREKKKTTRSNKLRKVTKDSELFD